MNRLLTIIAALLAAPLSASDTVTILSDSTKWSVGDTLVFNSYEYDRDDPKHEVKTIAAINGNTITVSTPFQHDHKGKQARKHTGELIDDLPAYVQNHSQPIRFESESQQVDRRGHIMLAHSQSFRWSGFSCWHLGRTDKSRTVTDPTLHLDDAAGRANPRGRYAIHAHKTYGTKDSIPGVWEDFSVYGSPGWGPTNHASKVAIRRAATADIWGAHLVCEVGSELGTMEDCSTIRSTGDHSPAFDSDRGAMDWGYQGSGRFALGGSAVQVKNCVHSGHFVAVMLMGQAEESKAIFPVSNLWFEHPQPNYPWGVPMMNASDVPMRIDGERCAGNAYSFVPWGIHNSTYHNEKSKVSNCVWYDGYLNGYSHKIDHDRCTFAGGHGHTGIIGLHDYNECNLLAGFQTPSVFHNYFKGGYINATVHTHNTPNSLQDSNAGYRILYFDGQQVLGPNFFFEYDPDFTHWDWREAIAGRMPQDLALAAFSRVVVGNDDVRWGTKRIMYEQIGDDYDMSGWLSLPAERRVLMKQNKAAGYYFGQLDLPADAERMPNSNVFWSESPAVDKR